MDLSELNIEGRHSGYPVMKMGRVSAGLKSNLFSYWFLNALNDHVVCTDFHKGRDEGDLSSVCIRIIFFR